MKKHKELTEKDKREIRSYSFKRKKYKITIPQISICTGYSASHLFAIEQFKYKMNEMVKKAYDRVIGLIENEAKKQVKYEKREQTK